MPIIRRLLQLSLQQRLMQLPDELLLLAHQSQQQQQPAVAEEQVLLDNADDNYDPIDFEPAARPAEPVFERDGLNMDEDDENHPPAPPSPALDKNH